MQLMHGEIHYLAISPTHYADPLPAKGKCIPFIESILQYIAWESNLKLCACPSEQDSTNKREELQEERGTNCGMYYVQN